MHRTLLLLPFLLAGCAPYADAQLALITQARRGLQRVEAAQAERAKLVEQYHRLQRVSLDQAFDDDVREREVLDPAWVIDHRRAYAAAVDALWTQQIASRDAEAAAAANLRAADQALQRLERLVSLPSQLISQLEDRP